LSTQSILKILLVFAIVGGGSFLEFMFLISDYSRGETQITRFLAMVSLAGIAFSILGLIFSKRKRVLFIAILFFALGVFALSAFWPSIFSRAQRHPNISSTEVPLTYKDLVKVFSPKAGKAVKSPLIVRGEARGNWFFEATFPVVLTDWDGKIIAEHYASAKLDPNDPNSTWMTPDFVPFEAKLEFQSPVFPGADENHFSRRGYLILKKDNPSGLLDYDDAFEIPIRFN
jgi:hypothetical protein